LLHFIPFLLCEVFLAMSGGYANPTVKLEFPEISTEGDPIWVVIRNPRIMPQAEIASYGDGADAVVDSDGKVTDRAAARQAANRFIARLVIAANVYDATFTPQFDDNGDVVGDATAPKLPRTNWSAEDAARIPARIFAAIDKEVGEAVSPQ
jgi:hypothetical protein